MNGGWGGCRSSFPTYKYPHKSSAEVLFRHIRTRINPMQKLFSHNIRTRIDPVQLVQFYSVVPKA